MPGTSVDLGVRCIIRNKNYYNTPPREGCEIRLYELTKGGDIFVKKGVSNQEYKFEG